MKRITLLTALLALPFCGSAQETTTTNDTQKGEGKMPYIRPVIDQIELHPFLTQPGVVGAIFGRGLAVEAWAPLGSGGGDLDEPALARIAEAHGRTPAQVVLRWHLQRGVVAIPRSSNPAHIAENLAVLDFELTPAEMAIVSGLDKNRRNFHKNDPESFPW